VEAQKEEFSDSVSDRFDSGGAGDSSVLEEETPSRASVTIRNSEIARIAIFKLNECAARLEELIKAAEDERLRQELKGFSGRVREMEAKLREGM